MLSVDAPNVGTESTRLLTLLPRNAGNDFWGKEPEQEPFQLPSELVVGLVMLWNVQMHGGPDAQRDGDDASREQGPGAAPVGFRAPGCSNIGTMIAKGRDHNTTNEGVFLNGSDIANERSKGVFSAALRHSDSSTSQSVRTMLRISSSTPSGVGGPNVKG